MTTYTQILVEEDERVGIITLNRPKVYNALSKQLVDELGAAVLAFEANLNIGCVLIKGNEKAFAAGADINEMANANFSQLFAEDFPYTLGAGWGVLEARRKPVIAAVSGLALGGGCELAMACDFILASESAKFGQPEVNLATLPGAGGTQRLARAVGKAKAMEMCLTGRMMSADEAEKCGLVSRVLPDDELFSEALAVAKHLADKSLPVTQLIKKAVDQAFETGLTAGLAFERHAFQSSFAFADQAEGMQAFVEKRKPKFKHK